MQERAWHAHAHSNRTRSLTHASCTAFTLSLVYVDIAQSGRSKMKDPYPSGIMLTLLEFVMLSKREEPSKTVPLKMFIPSPMPLPSSAAVRFDMLSTTIEALRITDVIFARISEVFSQSASIGVTPTVYARFNVQVVPRTTIPPLGVHTTFPSNSFTRHSDFGYKNVVPAL